MYNYTKKHKQLKIQTINNLQNTYKYLIFCLYNDLTVSQIINLKNNGLSFCLTRQKFFKKISNLTGKGSVLIIFFNEFNELNSIYPIIRKTEVIKPLFLLHDNKIISVYKLEKIIKTTNNIIYQLKLQIYNLYKILSKIN